MTVDMTTPQVRVGTASEPACCDPDPALPAPDPVRAFELAALAKALADPVRIQVLELLRGRRQSICQCELAPLFDISQPTLSHHLRKLEQARLVKIERRGKWAFYSADPDALEAFKQWLS